MNGLPAQASLGSKFGFLTAVELVERKPGRSFSVKCLCECGLTVIVDITSLRGGKTLSCGCWHKKRTSQTHFIHGSARTPEYKAWKEMNRRCADRNRPYWHNYGGRGISVCNEWRKSFLAFLSYVGLKPSSLHSLDRYPNNDGNYEPGNVRWATRSEQAINRRPRPKKENHGRTTFQ